MLLFLAHSKNELIQWRGIRRLSVRKLLRKSLLLPGKWPDHHQTFTRWDSRSACIQDVLKVKVKVKSHVIWALLCWHENRFFSQANGPIATKLAHDGLRVSLHPGCAQGQGHMIRALSWILGMSYSVIDGLVLKCAKKNNLYEKFVI